MGRGKGGGEGVERDGSLPDVGGVRGVEVLGFFFFFSVVPYCREGREKLQYLFLYKVMMGVRKKRGKNKEKEKEKEKERGREREGRKRRGRGGEGKGKGRREKEGGGGGGVGGGEDFVVLGENFF